MSSGADIKKKIQDAINIVKDFDEPYRTKAFEIILSKSISGEKQSNNSTKKVKKEKTTNLTDKIEKFASELNLSVDQLENVFEFSEDGPKIITPLDGTNPEKQASIAHSILVCLEHVYGEKSISAFDLAKVIDDFGVPTKNTPRSLLNKPEIFRKIGKRRSVRYRLTDVGKNQGLDLIKSLANPVANEA